MTAARSEAVGGRAMRRRNPRGEGARLRVELIDAAARLLEASGDARLLTLAAVAREAGIAAPSIYRHFADLSQLVEAVVADRFQQLDDALLSAMTDHPNPTERLRACCHAYCRFGFEHPGHYQVLFNAHLGLEPARQGDRPGERVFERLVNAVQACITAGSLQQEAHETAVNVWVALHGIVSLRTSRPNHAWPPVDTMIDAALSGQVNPPRTRAQANRRNARDR
jgi:AcrR family transcriptional regulator